jgi:hypothetical protein
MFFLFLTEPISVGLFLFLFVNRIAESGGLGKSFFAGVVDGH